jgi:hypothetical protein
MLIRAGYDVTRGYTATVDDIKKQQADPTKIGALQDALIEHLVAGEKYVQLVKLLPGERAKVEQWVRSKRTHANDLTAAFPGVAPEAQITPLRHLEPTAAGFAETEVGIAALFTSARSFVKTVPVPTSDLKPTAAAGFEKIVGYKNVFLQTYEAIWLPPKGDVLVLCVDYPADGATQNFPLQNAAFLTATVRKMLGRQISKANLWHAIDGLYQGADGKLVDYGFSAGGQSVNHHKARRKKSVCLRKAVYDAAGAKAVADSGKSLELFKAAMQWQLIHPDKVVVDPEVMIAGIARDLNKATPVVDHCVVRDCLTTRDLAFVVSKVLPHVKNWI